MICLYKIKPYWISSWPQDLHKQNVRTTCTWSWTCKPPPSFCLVALNRGLGDESWSAPVSIKGRKTTDVGAAKTESYVYTCYLNYDRYIYIHIFLCSNELAIMHRHVYALGVHMSCLKYFKCLHYTDTLCTVPIGSFSEMSGAVQRGAMKYWWIWNKQISW